MVSVHRAGRVEGEGPGQQVGAVRACGGHLAVRPLEPGEHGGQPRRGRHGHVQRRVRVAAVILPVVVGGGVLGLGPADVVAPAAGGLLRQVHRGLEGDLGLGRHLHHGQVAHPRLYHRPASGDKLGPGVFRPEIRPPTTVTTEVTQIIIR